jgi:hypothetical protein
MPPFDPVVPEDAHAMERARHIDAEHSRRIVGAVLAAHADGADKLTLFRHLLAAAIIAPGDTPTPRERWIMAEVLRSQATELWPQSRDEPSWMIWN